MTIYKKFLMLWLIYEFYKLIFKILWLLRNFKICKMRILNVSFIKFEKFVIAEKSRIFTNFKEDIGILQFLRNQKFFINFKNELVKFVK